jgi:hypothetical protein
MTSGFQDRRNQPLCHPSDLSECTQTEQFITPLHHYSKWNRGVLEWWSNGNDSVCDFLKRLIQDSQAFPVGTVPSEKFLEPIDITLVKIDKILSFTAGHLAHIRRRTSFDIV